MGRIAGESEFRQPIVRLIPSAYGTLNNSTVKPMNDPTYPDTFAATIRATFGEAGESWLRRLPQILADCACRWDLTIGPPFAPLSCPVVCN